MKRYLFIVALLASPAVLAATDADIVNAVQKKVQNGFFPKDVKVESVTEVRFFPDDRDTAYARFGNVCGKAVVSKSNQKASLVFIAPVVEKSSQISIDGPTIYDLSKQGAIAEEDLQTKCK
ncbi:hypothetical protein DN555_26940 [Enterobacter asburiae]|uniref:hypothetical protein n=1 Tax=Enterobacter cloacae complex TaxID=354276 RepID=UPI000EF1CB9B|nr:MULTISPECIES: hypothetical protein [Enterobacter cloacae complex]AYL05385.1 hypothetical protein D9T11_11585 [Enterobacter kobei]RWT07012.1 hypothetical protein DN555_26940 [Enterobacter asburiae]